MIIRRNPNTKWNSRKEEDDASADSNPDGLISLNNCF